MNPLPDRDPSISMFFIGGLLIIMSIISLFSPNRKMACHNDNNSDFSESQINRCILDD